MRSHHGEQGCRGDARGSAMSHDRVRPRTTTPTTSRSTPTRTRSGSGCATSSPLYYNEQHDFYALSRFADVERGSSTGARTPRPRARCSSSSRPTSRCRRARSSSRIPPTHDLHRGLLSRVFTPKKMAAIEPKVREFCARSLDPLVGERRLRLHRRPRRRDADAHDRHAARHPGAGPGGDPRPDRRGPAPRRDGGMPDVGRQRGRAPGAGVRGVHRLAGRAPLRRPDDRAAPGRVRGRDRDDPPAEPRRGPQLRQPDRRRPATRRRPASSAGRARSSPSTPTSAASSSRTAA